MIPIETDMHEIRRRFVRGILWKLEPDQFRRYVTGVAEDDAADAKKSA